MPILDDIVARRPGWAEGWNKRANVLCLIGEYDRSLGDADRVLALEPRHFDALAGKPREALTAFCKALAVNPFLMERLSLFQSWSASSESAIDKKATPEVPKTRRQSLFGDTGDHGIEMQVFAPNDCAAAISSAFGGT